MTKKLFIMHNKMLQERWHSSRALHKHIADSTAAHGLRIPTASYLMLSRSVNDCICTQLPQQLCLALSSCHSHYLGSQHLANLDCSHSHPSSGTQNQHGLACICICSIITQSPMVHQNAPVAPGADTQMQFAQYCPCLIPLRFVMHAMRL